MAKAKSDGSIIGALTPIIHEVWGTIKDDMLKALLHRLKQVAHELQKKYSGETIAVIGPPAAGKTTLLKVLQHPEIADVDLTVYNKTEIEEHERIRVSYKFNIGNGELVPFEFKVRKNSDVGGEEYIRENHWPRVLEGAAIVVYVIDTKVYLDDTGVYQHRILADFRWLLEKIQVLDNKFKVVLAFNKIDELCDRSGYRKFLEDHASVIGDLRTAILTEWPDELAPHLTGGTFLSLRDRGLRAFTLNSLFGHFVGEDLLMLYKGGK